MYVGIFQRAKAISGGSYCFAALMLTKGKYIGLLYATSIKHKNVYIDNTLLYTSRIAPVGAIFWRLQQQEHS